MQYIDRIKVNKPTDADNALILGQAVHTGIEKSLEDAIREYCFSYPIISDEHVNEIIKLEKVIPLARNSIPDGGQFEVKIVDNDFIGYIDYLEPVNLTCDEKDYICSNCEKNCDCNYAYGSYDCRKIKGVQWFDIYDFKYSNNVSNYMDSEQLHLYKYFFEKNNPGKKIRNLYFVFVPKVNIKQKKDETLQQFRNRISEELKIIKIKTIEIKFNYDKVIDFLLKIKSVNETTDFPQKKSYLCRYCEFNEYCEKGNDYFMKLPENKRRTIEKVAKRVIWIYGVPFCGKTTFANSFPDPLMINTDGNIKFVDAPYIHIKDEVRVEGRQTKRTLAWDIFKDTIAELEKKDNTFKTIVIDLLEDLYEHCRLYMYDKLGIEHESDDSFRAWDKVRGEFLNTLKRLMNLDYENIILISHEDTTKDITKKGGDKITAIKPNLQDKVAIKVAGMVDVVARIIADGDVRTFNFKSNEVIFGGGRLRVNANDIPLDVNALFTVYDEANKNAANGTIPITTSSETSKRGRSRKKSEETSITPSEQAEHEDVTSNIDTEDVLQEQSMGNDEEVTEQESEVKNNATEASELVEETPRKTRRTRRTRA